jgi:hypothetical protein
MAFFDENLAPSVTQETDAALVSLGQRGCVCLRDGATIAGNFAAIQCITDNLFITLDTVEGTGANSPFFILVDEAVVIPAGTIIYGPFTTIQNDGSQTAIAYKA